MLLKMVVEGHVELGQPVGSKWLSEQPDVGWSPSTIRYELAALEELGYLEPSAHLRRPRPDRRGLPLLRRLAAARGPAARARAAAGSSSSCRRMRREVDAAMRATTETLSQMTDLLAAVSAPPLHTATIKHVEVLLLQQQVALVVIITSTGAVTKRAFTFDEPVDAGPRRLGRELPERAARRHGPGRAHAPEQARQPRAVADRARVPRGDRARVLRPAPRRSSRRSTSRAPRGCSSGTGSRTRPR